MQTPRFQSAQRRILGLIRRPPTRRRGEDLTYMGRDTNGCRLNIPEFKSTQLASFRSELAPAKQYAVRGEEWGMDGPVPAAVRGTLRDGLEARLTPQKAC